MGRHRSSTIVMCRKCKRSDCLASFLRGQPDLEVREVGCQKLCHGPVAGLEVGGQMEWFERMDGSKAMVALVRLAEGRTTTKRADGWAKPLAKRRSRKHAGRPPR